VRKNSIIILAILIAISIAGFILVIDRKSESMIWINNQRIEVELAKTSLQKSRGLSGRENLCADCGMLFFLDKSEKHMFWMKEMKFNLDFVWINDNKVVKINRNISYLKGKEETIGSGVIADMILEVNAGKILEWGIEEGNEVVFE